MDAPLVVVTAASGDQRAGCVVGFHSQCSIEPPRYAVWLSKANRTYRVALFATHVALHVLGTEDERAGRAVRRRDRRRSRQVRPLRVGAGPGRCPSAVAAPQPHGPRARLPVGRRGRSRVPRRHADRRDRRRRDRAAPALQRRQHRARPRGRRAGRAGRRGCRRPETTPRGGSSSRARPPAPVTRSMWTTSNGRRTSTNRTDGPRAAPAGLVGLADGHRGVRRRGPAAVLRAVGDPALPAPGDHRRPRARCGRPEHLPDVHRRSAAGLPDLRQGARRLLPGDRLHLDDAQLARSHRLPDRSLPVLLSPRRGDAVRAAR